jgi:formylglycine-generating enzyme required for sulfatase activity
MSSEEFKYFFSYTRSDSEFVLKLAKELRELGTNLWLDQLDILGGQHWDSAVEEALKSCKGMIAVLSPDSVVSNNVMDEVSYALEKGKLVVPVLIRSCDIPFRLRRVQYIDFTADYDTGFSQLLRALRIEKTVKPPESVSAKEPVVSEPSLPKESEPTPDEQQPENEILTVPKDKRKDDRAMDTITQKCIKKLPTSFRNHFELDAEYILIPGGRYQFRLKIEQVSDIYFAKYPVTNKLYRRFIRYLEGKDRELMEILPMEEFNGRMTEFASGIKDFFEYLGHRTDKWPEKMRSSCDTNKDFNGEDQPVVDVSWFAARAYCYWISLLEAAGEKISYDKAAGLYRLPSEIEWEWAAGGGKREYPWPPEKGGPSHKRANYGGYVKTTTPVGRYPDGATPEGLMDMAGNVWEWMENWYDKDEDYRSLRGGSWGSLDLGLRCSERVDYNPVYRSYLFGFRVVRSP